MKITPAFAPLAWKLPQMTLPTIALLKTEVAVPPAPLTSAVLGVVYFAAGGIDATYSQAVGEAVGGNP
jgi:hypothetical protein